MVKKNLFLQILIVLMSGLVLAACSYGPNIPRGKIPANAPPRVREKIELLYSRNAKVRLQAVYALSDEGKAAGVAVPFLIAMLGDSGSVTTYLSPQLKEGKSFVGEAAAHALIDISDSGVVDPLIACLNNKDWQVRRNALLALSSLESYALRNDPRVFDAIARSIMDKDLMVRLAAINSLWLFKGDSRIPNLIVIALKEERPEIQLAAASELKNIDSLRAIKVYANLLKDNNADTRLAALTGLSSINDRRAREPIIAALRDKSESVRAKAAVLLSGQGDERAIEPLIGVLSDKSEVVVSYAMQALTGITGKDFGQDKEKWSKWWENELMMRHLESIAR